MLKSSLATNSLLYFKPTFLQYWITMKTLSKVLASSALAAAALSFGGVAQAATLTVGPTTLPLTTTDFNLALTPLAQFDPSLGTLTQVTILRNGSMATSGTITNNSTSSGGTFATQVFANLTITVAGAAETLPNLFVQRSATLTAAPGPGNSASFSGTDTDSLSTILNSGLAAFIGTGTVPVLCDTQVVQFTGGPGGNASSTNATAAGCDVTITYEYTAAPVGTPEPAMVLGLLAVGGAGALTRRKG